MFTDLNLKADDKVFMNISRQYTTNLDIIGHKRKEPDVSTEQLSPKLNNNKQTPLERNSQNLSFKGVSGILIKKTKPMALNTAMQTLRNAIGDSADKLLAHIKQSESMSKRIIINTVDDTILFKEKTPVYLLVEGLKYPFTKLPFHLMDWALKGMKNSKLFKDAKWIDNVQKKDFYKKMKLTAKDDDKLNALRGIIESANKYKYDSAALQKSSLVSDATKMFDPKTGNYNGVHERALTRIVTGFIPAFFLANDAYNLSRLMNDNKNEADHEKKVRFNQESKRVLSNAYIQLITMGALSKYINKSKLAIVATTFITVLATETYSRVSNGKRIHFLSEQEAKNINAKKNKKLEQKENDTQAKQPGADTNTTGTKAIPNFKNSIMDSVAASTAPTSAQPAVENPIESSLFKDFSIMKNVKSIGSVIKNPKDEKKETEKELKPLLSLSSVLKASAVIIAAGFGIKGLKSIKINNKKPVAEFFKKISDKYNSVYKSLTEKDHNVKKDDFIALVEKIRTNGFEKIGDEYKAIAERFQKKTAIDKFKKEFIADLEAAGIDGAKNFGKIDKTSIMKKEINNYITHLRNNRQDSLANFVKETMFDTKGNLIDFTNAKTVDKAYTKIIKQIKTSSLEEHIRPFDNTFKINDGENIIGQFEENIAKLKAMGKNDTATKYEKLINNALNATEYNFGKKNKFFKPALDFVIAPFKFIWSTITLPYRVVNMAINIKKPMSPPKAANEVEMLSNSILKLGKNVKQENKAFKHDFDENITKSFNKLSMSGVSNAELSNLAKMSGTAATTGFLITDNYNMVMLKSDGENKKDAQVKAKERVVQETSRLFYNMLFIDLFNKTFSNAYHNSLLGAQMVNTASTVIGEYTNRTAIGVPVKAESRDTILNNEYKNFTNPGPKGKFFRFMSRLTGKKVLSQREPMKKPEETEVKK